MIGDLLNSSKRKLPLSSVLGIVAIFGLSFAVLVQEASYRRRITALEEEVRAARFAGHFRRCMDMVFGELGSLIMKDAHDVKVYAVPTNTVELYNPTPDGVLSLLSTLKDRRRDARLAPRLYDEFTQHNVDFQSSYYDPVPTALLKISRNGETVILVLGREVNVLFVKVLVFDNKLRVTNERRNGGGLDPQQLMSFATPSSTAFDGQLHE